MTFGQKGNTRLFNRYLKEEEIKMKITVKRDLFTAALTTAMGTVSKKNTITNIEGFLIETTEDGKVQISSYDMTKGIRIKIDAESIEREGKYIINAQRLMQTVRSLSEEDIEIDVDSSYICTISSGRASFSMSSIRGEDFPSFPELTTDKGFEIDSEILAKMISKVTHSVAEQSTRQMLCGAYLKIKENTIEMVSCNTFILSKCTAKCDISSLTSSSVIDLHLIIPGHALGELSKILLDGEEKAKIYISKKHAIVKTGSVIFFTRTIESEYIDYNRIIPKENDIFVTIEKEKLLDSLERANIIADEKIKGSDMGFVRIKAEDQIFHINSTSVNGKIKDEIECVHEGEDIEMGFNCRYIMNSVRVADGENIILSMKTPTLAITIEPYEKSEEFDYLYIVLPIKLKDATAKNI